MAKMITRKWPKNTVFFSGWPTLASKENIDILEYSCCTYLLLNRMCTHQTKVKRNGKIMDFDDTWVG